MEIYKPALEILLTVNPDYQQYLARSLKELQGVFKHLRRPYLLHKESIRYFQNLTSLEKDKRRINAEDD